MQLYGRVDLDRKRKEWLIECEPQVKARAKRVFARVSKAAAQYLPISDTVENARDLRWFLERYPMAMSDADRAHLDAQADAHVDMERRLADLLSGVTRPRAVSLAKPPRDYQLFAAECARIRGGLLLGDAVGVGKTVSGLLPIADPAYCPAVFVAETHLCRQMEQKLAEFLPARQVHRVRKGTPYDLLVRKPRMQLRADRLPDVIVVSYHMLRGWAETLATFARYVVFDEVQRLRSGDTAIWHAAKHLADRVGLRMGLSATPIYNYGHEFWNVIECLVPGALGTREEFIREWCTAGADGKARLSDPDEFGQYLRREGVLLRRTRADVGREIPAGQRIVHTVDTDTKVLEQLEGDAVKLARVILAVNEAHKGERMQASAEFDNLMRQATGIAKAPYVAEFVRLLLESGEKVLLFGWHREVYRIWQERLEAYRPLMYTGSESPAQKEAAKAAFLGRGPGAERNLMIMSLRAGAGTDGIQHVCSTAVVGELDWSPGVHEQCLGRIERDGQPNPTVGYFLVAEHGADPIISAVCGIKAEQRDGVLDPGSPMVARVDTGENQIRALARALLERRGERAPTAVTPIAAARLPAPRGQSPLDL